MTTRNSPDKTLLRTAALWLGLPEREITSVRLRADHEPGGYRWVVSLGVRRMPDYLPECWSFMVGTRTYFVDTVKEEEPRLTHVKPDPAWTEPVVPFSPRPVRRWEPVSPGGPWPHSPVCPWYDQVWCNTSHVPNGPHSE